MSAASRGLASHTAQAVAFVWVNQAGTVWYPEEGDVVYDRDGYAYRGMEGRGGTMYDNGSVEEQRLIAQ
jgi:hypothetical protein